MFSKLLKRLDPNEPTFYALTTLTPDERERRLGLRHRTVGIFQTLQEAAEVLEKNYGDLNEAGEYNYAVIEEMPYHLYPSVRIKTQWWYRWEGAAEGRWVMCLNGPPAWTGEGNFKHFANWASIG